MFFGFATLKPGSVGKQRHKLPRRYMVTDTSPVGAEAEHWRGVHSQFVANHPHRSRGARHWRGAVAKWHRNFDRMTADCFEARRAVAELEDEATRAWQQSAELEESKRDLQAQLASYQLQVQALAVQREKELENVRYWYRLSRELQILANQRAEQLANARKGVDDMSKTLAEQAEVTASELAAIQDRWQRCEDQRFAAVEQCVALEERCAQLDDTVRIMSDVVTSAHAVSARRLKAFRRGMRIMQQRIDVRENDLAMVELSEEAAKNWAETLGKTGIDALELLCGDASEPISSQLAMLEHCLLLRFAAKDHKPEGQWLSMRAVGLESQLAEHQQAEREAIGGSRELTQAEQCQACGRERREWEGFVRGADDVWRCGPCHDRAVSPSEDLAVRLSMPIEPPQPTMVQTLGCDTCACWELPGHVEPCLSCESAGDRGSNWAEPGSLVELACEDCGQHLGAGTPHVISCATCDQKRDNAKACSDAVIGAALDQKAGRMKSLREMGWAEPVYARSSNETSEPSPVELPAGICWDCGSDGMTVSGDGHVRCDECDERGKCEPSPVDPSWVKESEPAMIHYCSATCSGLTFEHTKEEHDAPDLLPDVNEADERTEYQFQPTDRDYRGLIAQSDRVTEIKRRLDALNAEATARLVEHVREDEELAKWFVDTATGALVDSTDTDNHLTDLSIRRPTDCTSEQSRALTPTRRNRRAQTARRQQENRGVSALGGGGAEGRTCDEELPNDSNQAVTEAPSETACQNMAKRLASQSPGRVTSGWLDRVLDILSRAGRLNRTEDLALRILVKRPTGRD